MTDNEEWFEVARRNYVAALNAGVTGTRLDDLEEEYEEAKRFRATPAVASAAATVTPQERATPTPSTTAQADNGGLQRPRECEIIYDNDTEIRAKDGSRFDCKPWLSGAR